jgi:hypothetical protein
VTIDQSLNLLTISLIDFNDFCTFSTDQDSFRLFKIVKRAYSSRELRHRHEVNDLFLHELSIPEDEFTVIPSSNNQTASINIDNLPHRLCVCFNRLTEGPSLPYLQLPSGAASQHNLVGERILAANSGCDTRLPIETPTHSQVDTVKSEKLHVFNTTSGKLSLILPTRIEHSIRVYS